MHKQLTQLLSHNEQDELKTAKSFEPFRSEHSDLTSRILLFLSCSIFKLVDNTKLS